MVGLITFLHFGVSMINIIKNFKIIKTSCRFKKKKVIVKLVNVLKTTLYFDILY